MKNIFKKELNVVFSTDEFFSGKVSVQMTTEDVKEFLSLMSDTKELSEKYNKSAIQIRIYTNCIDMIDYEHTPCNVHVARVYKNSLMFELKHKYTPDIYESDELSKEELENWLKNN